MRMATEASRDWLHQTWVVRHAASAASATAVRDRTREGGKRARSRRGEEKRERCLEAAERGSVGPIMRSVME